MEIFLYYDYDSLNLFTKKFLNQKNFWLKSVL